MNTWAKPPLSIWKTSNTTHATVCTLPLWPAPGWPSSQASGDARHRASATVGPLRPRLRPRLPSALTRLSLRLVYRGRRLQVTITGDQATHELLKGLMLWNSPTTASGSTLQPGRPETRTNPAD